jgi:hypothetical protein
MTVRIKMNESDGNSRRYRWPWFVLAAFLLFVTLAILWMRFEVRKVEQERNVNTPPPAGGARQ